MDEKPIPLRTGDITSSIPPAASSIAAVGVRVLEANVPESHNSFLRSMGVKLGVDAGIRPSTVLNRFIPRQPSVPRREVFERGDVAIDIQKNTRVTVIKCAVARTKKGTPVHRVVCKETGDSWKVAENKLKMAE